MGRIATWIGVVGMMVAAVGCTTASPTSAPPSGEVAVNVFADTDDGACDATHCSLREAIAAANADPAVDTVVLPAGTFLIGGGGGAALRAGAAALVAQVVGPQGEAFHVTEDLTITGAGAGATIIDFSGDDFTIGWLTEATLSLSSLTVANLGSGTDPVSRTVVATDMATAGESIIFDQAVVEQISTDVILQPVVPPATPTGVTNLVRFAEIPPVPPVTPVDVTIQDSTIRHFGPGDVLVAVAGTLAITDSLLDDVPRLGAAGGSVPITLPVDVSGSTIRRTTTVTWAGGADPSIADPQCSPSGVASFDGAVALSDTTVEVDQADPGPCGGAAISGPGVAVSSSGGSVTIDRSLLRAPGGLAALYLTTVTPYDPDTGTFGTCREATGALRDSTLVAPDFYGLFFVGNCENPAPGIRFAVERSTILANIGLTAGGAVTGGQAGDPTEALISVQGSAIAGTTAGCNPTTNGVGMIQSLGNNTATSSNYGCDGAPGDQILSDLQVGPLADNGGPTLTAAPLTGSPLIDTAGACSGTDQRGVTRPQGTACDRGAVEQ